MWNAAQFQYIQHQLQQRVGQDEAPSYQYDPSTRRLEVSGHDQADNIHVSYNADNDNFRVSYVDGHGEQRLLTTIDAQDIDEIRVSGLGGDDVISVDGSVNAAATEGRPLPLITIGGGEGDDVVVNQADGALIEDEAGSDTYLNSGDHVRIEQPDPDEEEPSIEGSDYVYSDGDHVHVQLNSNGDHHVDSVGVDGAISLAGAGDNTLNVEGPGRRVALGAGDNSVTGAVDESGIGAPGDQGADGAHHVVAAGDTLWDIAGRYGGDPFRWVELAEHNGLTNPELIHPGQAIEIPDHWEMQPSAPGREGPTTVAGSDQLADPPGPMAGTGTADDFVRFALAQDGDVYIFGAETQLDDPNPTTFDCSELVQWAAHQAGVTIPDGSANQSDHVRRHGTQISVQQALETPGALLFRPGHVAISLGDGRTIEAKGRNFGVGIFEGRNRFETAGLIPGMSYGTNQPGQPV